MTLSKYEQEQFKSFFYNNCEDKKPKISLCGGYTKLCRDYPENILDNPNTDLEHSLIEPKRSDSLATLNSFGVGLSFLELKLFLIINRLKEKDNAQQEEINSLQSENDILRTHNTKTELQITQLIKDKETLTKQNNEHKTELDAIRLQLDETTEKQDITNERLLSTQDKLSNLEGKLCDLEIIECSGFVGELPPEPALCSQ